MDFSGPVPDWILRDTSVPSPCLPPISSPPQFPPEDLVGDLSLYNATDLARELASAEVSDEQLILAAFARWAADCPAHLEGEFAFAIRDSLRNELFLAVDHFATIPICYWQNGSRFLFASDPALLLSHPEIPRELNRTKVREIFLDSEDTNESDSTFHAGIHSIPPGHSLTFGTNGIRLRCYWRPQISDDLVPSREDEAFEMLRELLFASIRNRLRMGSRTGVLLSGGLDSSAITAIAAGILESQGAMLPALSSVAGSACATAVRDERQFIELFRARKNIQLEFIEAAGRGPFDRLEDQTTYERTMLLSSRQFLYEEFDRAALDQGVDLLLDGCLGELSATTRGRGYYLELLRHQRWSSLAGEFKGSSSRLSTARSIGSEAQEWFKGTTPQQDPIVLLADEFRASCTAKKKRTSRICEGQRGYQLAAVTAAMSRHSNRAGAVSLRKVRKSFPMLDRKLLEFCISAPASMKVRAGYSRYLVRRALDGVLPPKIQWRTSKMPFSPDYYLRYNAQLSIARHFVAAIGRHDPVRTIVDVDRLGLLLEPVHPVQGSWDALMTIPSTLYMICFLRQFAEFR